MKRLLFIFLLFLSPNVINTWAQKAVTIDKAGKSEHKQGKVILVTPPEKGYCNSVILRAFEEAAKAKGRPTTIQLQLGRYVFGRDESIHQRYLISNTASES